MGSSEWMHHLCLYRVVIDPTPPEYNSSTPLGCTSCTKGTEQRTPLGEIAYAAPRDGQLRLIQP